MSKVKHSDFTELETAAHRVAVKTLKNAYAPYSKFQVAATLYTADGQFFPGCNVENVTSGVGVCAERTALVGAVARGQKKFAGIVIIARKASAKHLVYPCGVCRQALKEFFPDSFKILLGDAQKLHRATTLGELFPHSFGPEDL